MVPKHTKSSASTKLWLYTVQQSAPKSTDENVRFQNFSVEKAPRPPH